MAKEMKCKNIIFTYTTELGNEVLERFAPSGVEYHHDETWHDGNGHSHLRASIVGNNTMVPLVDGVLQLGQWQQIVLIDFDTKARSRKVWVQIIY